MLRSVLVLRGLNFIVLIQTAIRTNKGNTKASVVTVTVTVTVTWLLVTG